MNPTLTFYEDTSGFYYVDSYQEASNMSSNMSELNNADELPLANERVPAFTGYVYQQMEDPFVDHMHTADRVFYPSTPNYATQIVDDHSQIDLQGGAFYQGPIPCIDPALLPSSNILDNTSMSNTFGNHHVGHRGVEFNATNYHDGECALSSSVGTLFTPPDKILDNTSTSNTFGNHHVDHGGMNVNVTKSHDGESAKPRSVGGGARTKGHGNPFDPNEILGANRLWNFEPFHTNALPDKTLESEPLLTDDDFATMVRLPYDPLWIDKRGIDRSSIIARGSILKFEKLFIDSVLMVGDLLVVGDVDEGMKKNLRNTALVLNVSRETNWWPDLQIRAINGQEGGYEVLKRCKGTQQLVKALIEEDIRMRSTKCGTWKSVTVFRNGVDLGSMEKVRDEYQVWVGEVDKWASRNNQRRCTRRSRGSPGLIWQGKKLYRVLSDGSTELVDDLEHQPIPVYQHHMRVQSLPGSSQPKK